MSLSYSKTDVLFQQRLLACSRMYTGKLDGLWGPKTEAASKAFVLKYEALKKDFGALDTRSEKNIATLLPAMQQLARRIMAVALDNRKQGYTFSILSGTRTYAEQNIIYAQGRTRPGRIVTNARGGQSNHNFGLAIDIGIFDAKGKYLTGANRAEVLEYNNLGKAVQRALQPADWGGLWKTPDMPHYEIKTGYSLAQKRALFENGKLYL